MHNTGLVVIRECEYEENNCFTVKVISHLSQRLTVICFFIDQTQ